MVYILTANKPVKYRNGRSRIIYIGTTKRGAGRPAASAVNMASKAFNKVHGLKRIEVHIATCGARQAMQTWKRLESSLIDTFRKEHFELPKYNKVRPKAQDGIFQSARLRKLIVQFDN